MTREEAEEVLALYRCETPAGGTHPGGHCAACCYGTGYLVTGWDDVTAVNEALAELGHPLLPWPVPT